MNSVSRFDKKGSWSKRKMPVLQTGDSGAIPDGSNFSLAQQALDGPREGDVRISNVVVNRLLCGEVYRLCRERFLAKWWNGRHTALRTPRLWAWEFKSPLGQFWFVS